MQVLDRGEKIELLVDKTENLRSQVNLAVADCLFRSWANCVMLTLFWIDLWVLLQAQDFRQQGTKMRRKMWIQNMKIKLIVLGIIIALILIIVLSVCHGFKCWFGLGKSLETVLCCPADMVDLVHWPHLLILASLSLVFVYVFFFFAPLLGHHALTCPLAREWICIFSIACIGYMLELLEIDKYLMLPAVVLCCLLLYVDFSLRCNGTIVGYLQNWSFLWHCYLKLISNKRLVRDKLSDKKNTHFNIIYFVH